MVVKTQYEGFRISGLYVGVNNVRRYFSKRSPVVELQLDHLQIQCGLTAGFWKGQPEIHDHRLCEWLESKRFHEKPCSTPVLLALIPFGKNSFKVTSLGADWKARKGKAKPVDRTRSSATEVSLDEDKVALVGVA